MIITLTFCRVPYTNDGPLSLLYFPDGQYMSGVREVPISWYEKLFGGSPFRLDSALQGQLNHVSLGLFQEIFSDSAGQYLMLAPRRVLFAGLLRMYGFLERRRRDLFRRREALRSVILSGARQGFPPPQLRQLLQRQDPDLSTRELLYISDVYLKHVFKSIAVGAARTMRLHGTQAAVAVRPAV